MAVCSQCGATSDGAKFCPECGTPLVVVAVARRERRVVSVVFADLVGFTSRSERLDVEDVQAFLGGYHDLLRRQLESHGGAVEKFIGDAVMALFGVPLAHEDDPERAVRAALSIQGAVGERRDRDGVDLHVRVGVTSGEALVALEVDPRSGEGVATGDVVNTAARLQSAAPVDGVLVDERTYRATDRSIRYDDAEAVTAKGKAEPVAVWRALEPRSLVPEQMRDDLPLVGRRSEVDLLVAALTRSREEPSTQLVTVVGSPGIGKSRLVAELGAAVDELPDLVTWRRGRSLAYGEGIAFWALGEMVKGQAGILESDRAEATSAKLAEAVSPIVADERDREWVTRHLGPLVGVGGHVNVSAQDGRLEAFAAWRRFFEALAEMGPAVLVFEDIHWADDALLDFIDLLADRAGAVPLLIVCTARPELLDRRTAWGGGKTNTTTISLQPLTPDDTARLVGGMLDQALLPAEVQRALMERAEGNPLYAQEYVRMLKDRGVLVQTNAGWTLAGDVEGLPESIHGVIAARLDTLTPDERSLIQDAAVVGKTAWLGAITALTHRSSWEAEELIHALERKQLLQRTRRSSIDGEVEFAFSHALTQEVAYSQIRRADRAQKHEAAAAWIEALAGERDDKAELLADHYHQALTLLDQLGQDTTGIAPKARAAFTEAATQATAVHAHNAAARQYHAALQLTPGHDTKHRAMLLLGEARALYSTGAADEAILRTAADAQVDAQEWEAAATAERLVFDWYEDHQARGEDAAAHLERAAEYAARVAPSEVMCEIASDQAYRLVISGQAEEALGLTNRIIPVAEQAGLEVGRATMLQWRGSARLDLGDADGGIADLRSAAQTLADHAHRATPSAFGNLADALRGMGDMPAADAAYTTANQWATRFALLYIIDWIAIEQAYQAYHAGRWVAAEQLLAAIDTTAKQTATRSMHRQARMSFARGRIEDALADAQAITSQGTTAHNDEALYHGLGLEVLCHVASRRDAEALEACERFLARWHETGGIVGRALELCEIAPTLATARRHEQIRDAAALLPETCRWRVALLQMAHARYAEAATLYEQIGSQPLAADAHLLAAHQATQSGRTAEAEQHAQAVSAFAQQTGATLYQQRAEEFLKASA